jgi:hypothetical protein
MAAAYAAAIRLLDELSSLVEESKRERDARYKQYEEEGLL